MLRRRVVQTGLRVHVDLHARLTKEAKRRGVSLNAEMEQRLAASFTLEETVKDQTKMLAHFADTLPMETLLKVLKGDVELMGKLFFGRRK